MKRLSEIPLQDNDRRAVKAAGTALRSRLPVRDIILFGSKARGEDDPESDIDLLVLTDRAVSREEQRLVIDLLFPIELEYELVFSTLEIPVAEWDHGVYQVLPSATRLNGTEWQRDVRRGPSRRRLSRDLPLYTRGCSQGG